MSNHPRRRMLVIALDGATLDLIRPWVEEGRLPVLGQLMREGAWSVLESTIPPITPVAWTTFMTGKNPGKHGIYDFFRPIQDDYGDLSPVSASLNHEPTLWQILSRRGRRVCVVNVPMTYPAQTVNGVIYAGVPTPSQAQHFSYPPSVHSELAAQGWDLSRDATTTRGSYEEYFDHLIELVKVRTDAALHLWRKEPWDFYMVHYLETDQVVHSYWRFWEYHDQSHPLHDAMLRLFQFVDQQLARLLAHLSDDTSLLVLSDHGMGPVHYHIHLTNWLLRERFMHWRASVPTRLRRVLYRLGLTPTRIYNRMPQAILQWLTLGQLRSELAEIRPEGEAGNHMGLLRRLRGIVLRAPFLDYRDIDWSRSLAYSTGTTQVGYIHLNVLNREPEGCVGEGDHYLQVRDKIRHSLEQWVNPITGELMVDRVLFREELYNGDQLDHAPDIIVLYREHDYEAKKGTIFLSNKVVEPISNANATHRIMGMCLARGPGIRPGLVGESAPGIVDMTPLVLYLMGEPIPVDFDGELPMSMIEPEHLSNYPPAWCEPEPKGERQPEPSRQEDADVVERLRGLGYIQ